MYIDHNVNKSLHLFFKQSVGIVDYFTRYLSFSVQNSSKKDRIYATVVFVLFGLNFCEQGNLSFRQRKIVALSHVPLTMPCVFRRFVVSKYLNFLTFALLLMILRCPAEYSLFHSDCTSVQCDITCYWNC